MMILVYTITTSLMEEECDGELMHSYSGEQIGKINQAFLGGLVSDMMIDVMAIVEQMGEAEVGRLWVECWPWLLVLIQWMSWWEQ